MKILKYNYNLYITALMWYLGCKYAEAKVMYNVLFSQAKYTYLDKIALSYLEYKSQKSSEIF